MTDELYDYFGGNAPKKVEPIEDDDFDSLDDAEAIVSIPEPIADITTTSGEDRAIETTPSAAAEKGSHWDFLAGILGIKRDPEKSTAAENAAPPHAVAQSTAPTREADQQTTEKLVDRVSTQETTATPPAVPPRPEPMGDFFGFDPIPSPEDDTILPSMFNPPSDSAVQDLDSIAEDVDVNDAAVTENVDDDGNEYLEFEIEDLDDSPYVDGEEEAFGRRRRNASNRIEKSDSGAANQQSGRRENKPRSRTEPRREEGDVRERPPSTRRSESPAPAAERTVDFEDGDAPRRPRRRRGRGRGRSKEGQDLTASNDSTSNSQTPDPVADEIGWVTPAFNEDRKGKRQEDPVAKTHDRESSSRSSRTSKDDNRSSRESSRAPRDDSRSRQSEANYKSRNVSQSSRNQSARNQAADEFEVNSIDDTGEQAESTSGRSRRRRRRGRKPRGNEPSPQSEKPILDDETFDDDLSDDISSQGNYDGYDDDDLGSDDFDSEEFTSHSSPADDRAPKRGRRPRRSAGRSREQSVDADVNEDTEKVRFPTWEEAISVLVETNIKNHSRSPNRGGGGGGRGRSGGGNRGRSH